MQLVVHRKNPLSTAKAFPFMRIAFDALLNGGFTRKSLRQRLERELDWTPASSNPHVDAAVKVLQRLNLVEVGGPGHFRIRRMMIVKEVA